MLKRQDGGLAISIHGTQLGSMFFFSSFSLGGNKKIGVYMAKMVRKKCIKTTLEQADGGHSMGKTKFQCYEKFLKDME